MPVARSISRSARTLVVLVLFVVVAGCAGKHRASPTGPPVRGQDYVRSVPIRAARDGGAAGQCFVHFTFHNHSEHQIEDVTWSFPTVGTQHTGPIAAGSPSPTMKLACNTSGDQVVTAEVTLRMNCTKTILASPDGENVDYFADITLPPIPCP